MKKALPEAIFSAVRDLLAPYQIDISSLMARSKQTSIEKKYLTISESETYSGIGRWTLARAAKAGKIRQVKLSACRGGKVLIDKASLDSWLDSLEV